jgi:hypothetical protein
MLKHGDAPPLFLAAIWMSPVPTVGDGWPLNPNQPQLSEPKMNLKFSTNPRYRAM